MIETGGVAAPDEKTFAANPVTLRFNVDDVEQSVEWLRGGGVAVSVHRWDWGVTGLFLDPDGNRCELKDHRNSYMPRQES